MGPTKDRHRAIQSNSRSISDDGLRVAFFMLGSQRIYFALWQKDQIKKRKRLQQICVHNTPRSVPANARLRF